MTFTEKHEQAGAELGKAQISYTLALQAWLTLAFMFIESSCSLLLVPCYWLLATSYLKLSSKIELLVFTFSVGCRVGGGWVGGGC